MNLEEITVSYQRKWGLPEYSSFDIFCSAKAKIETQGTHKECAEALMRFCKNSVEQEGEKKLKEYWSKK